MSNLSAFHDTPEKDHVRRTCWLPLLLNRKRAKGSRVTYLTLPGKELTEIKLLVNEGVIEGMKDLILCEEHKRRGKMLPLFLFQVVAPSFLLHIPAVPATL